jgi:membrane associated rhomboid family serine protease
MTLTIILLNTGVFFFETSLSERGLKNLIYIFAFVPARYSHSDWLLSPALYLPFLTSIFIHGGWMHLISNMWSLWIFGDNVEDRMGHIRFLFFYLLCGIAAGVVHWVTNLHSQIPTVGASGAIAGVMGAYFLLYPYSRVITMVPVFFYPVFIEIPAVFYLGLWFYSQFLSGVMSLVTPRDIGGIAWWAHIGGFLAGGLLMPLFIRRKRYP